MGSISQQEHCCSAFGKGEVIFLACFFTILAHFHAARLQTVVYRLWSLCSFSNVSLFYGNRMCLYFQSYFFVSVPVSYFPKFQKNMFTVRQKIAFVFQPSVANTGQFLWQTDFSKITAHLLFLLNFTSFSLLHIFPIYCRLMCIEIILSFEWSISFTNNIMHMSLSVKK